MISAKNSIIGTLALVLGVIGTMFISSLRAEDPRVAHERERVQLCKEIGKLYGKCYTGNESSCDTLHEKQEDYLANYEVSEFQDCDPKYGEPVNNETEKPEQKTEEKTAMNPLFYGDEEGNS